MFSSVAVLLALQHQCVAHRDGGGEVVFRGIRIDFARMDGQTWVRHIGMGCRLHRVKKVSRLAYDEDG